MEKSAFCFRNKKIMSVPPWFDQITNIYKQNYAAYKVSGNASHKAAYEWASAWMDRVITMENASVAQDSERIKNFMESYETSNKNVTKLDAALKEIKQKGPQLESEYAQSKRIYEKQIEAIDNTHLYIKGAVVAGLLVIAGIAGAL